MDLLTKTFLSIFILLILCVSLCIVIVKNRKSKIPQETMQIQSVHESLFDKLIKLKNQRDDGELTQKEYEEMKNKYLGII